MRKSSMLVITVMLVMIAGLYQVSVIGQAAENVNCTIDFEATVHTGSNAGLSLQGDLALTVDPSGNAAGTLAQTNGSEIKAVG